MRKYKGIIDEVEKQQMEETIIFNCTTNKIG